MKEIIPLFPAKVVVFPDQELSLQIADKRYQKLIEDCWQNNATFGIQPLIDDKVQNTGTQVEIIKLDKKQSHHRIEITIKGKRVYRLLNHRDSIKHELYSNGIVAFIPPQPERDQGVKDKLISCLQQFEQLLFNSHKLYRELSSANTIYDIVTRVGLSLKKQYSLLANPSESGRRRILLNHCRQQYAIEKQVMAISDKLVDN